MSRPPSSSSSSGSRGSHGQVTLPPIRQIFREELERPVLPHQARSSPSFGRVRLEEDPRYSSRGASSPAPHVYAPGTSRSSTYPDRHQPPAHQPRGSSEHHTHSQNMPDSTMSYPNDYAHQYVQSHHPRTPLPTGSYPYSGSHPVTHPNMMNGHPPQHQPYPGSEATASDRSTSSARYECSYCGKGFTRPSSLRIHINTHTGEKPFTCPHEGCGRSFSVQSNMRRHARVHTRGMEVQSGDPEDDGDSASEE